MQQRLPPLNALIGFEAAARLGSFSKAATELNVTQSAISHQIRIIESALGQPLFRRLGRHVVTTDAGADFLTTVHRMIETLQSGIARLEPYRKPSSVVVYTTNALATCWLLPRIHLFRQKFPAIDIWLDTSGRKISFLREEVDVLIAQEKPRDGDIVVKHLFGEVLKPICAPSLQRARPSIRKPADLCRYTLLHDERSEDWAAWFQAAGISDCDTIKGPNFSDSGVLLEAAAAGHGVALGSDVLAERYVREGRLAWLFGPELKAQGGYYLMYAPQSVDDPEIRPFCDWIESEGQNFRQKRVAAPT